MGVQITLTDGTKRQLIEYDEVNTQIVTELTNRNLAADIQTEVESQVEALNLVGTVKTEVENQVKALDLTDAVKTEVEEQLGAIDLEELTKDPKTYVLTSPDEKLEDIIDMAVGDFAIVKSLIADDKYSYTGYTYSEIAEENFQWVALDGNYNANNVYFDNDFTITQDIGTFKINGAKSSNIAASGKSLKTLLSEMFAEEKQSTKTDPTFKISSLTASTPNNDLEIGTYISAVTVDTTFTDGKYSEGTVDSTGKNYSSNTNAGCKAATYELSNSLFSSSANINAKSGTFNFSVPGSTELPTKTKTYTVSSGSGIEIIPGNGGHGDVIYEAIIPLLQLETETEVKFKVTINQIPDTAFNSAEVYAKYFAETGTNFDSDDYAYVDVISIEHGQTYPTDIAAGYVQPVTVADTTTLTWCEQSDFNTEKVFSASEDLPKTFEVTCIGTNFNLKLIEPQVGFNKDQLNAFVNRYSLYIEAEWTEAVPQLQIDSTNSKAYCTITGKCTYEAPERLPATNLGNESTCEEIQAGTLEANKELKLTGYRKCFYKVNDSGNVMSIDALKSLASDTIRSTFACVSNAPSTLPTELNLTAGTQQLVFLAPAGTYTKFSVTDITNPQATFTLGNENYAKALKVEGANNFAGIDYDMWVISLDVPYQTDATINIERSK